MNNNNLNMNKINNLIDNIILETKNEIDIDWEVINNSEDLSNIHNKIDIIYKILNNLNSKIDISNKYYNNICNRLENIDKRIYYLENINNNNIYIKKGLFFNKNPITGLKFIATLKYKSI